MKTTVNNDTAKVISDENKTNVYTGNKTYTIKGITNIANTTANQQKAVVSNGGKIVYEADHNKLTNRDKVDQHPISAITGLEEALKNAGTGSGGEGKVKDVLVDGTSVLDENGNANINGLVKEESFNQTINEFEQVAENLDNRMSDLEQVGGEIIENLENKANKNEIPSLEGYATEEWVKGKDYMPIPDFQEFMQYSYYDKTQVYNKEEIDTKLEELPTGTEYKATDNVVIEDNTIKVVTNTGYKVIDKDIQMQPIADSGTTGANKMAYTDDETIIIYDGTNKIRRSDNGKDFEVVTLPCTCKAMAYNSEYKRLYGTDGNNYFIFSEDNGVAWKMVTNTQAKNVDYLDIGFGAGFRAINKSAKRIIGFTFNENNSTISTNTTITSTIIPEHIAMVNNTQFVWCNSSGTFKYGAGSNEGDFASLSGITANLLKRVNNITILGLKNNNKIYLLEPAASIRDYKWVEYTLPDTCTVNDIIFNAYDETYYIFTTVNTYYKTKDFVSYESIDKNGFRGTQGYFTLMGIQMVTSEKNYLLLAPTRTTLENKAQEWDRALNKERWVGLGLGVDGEQIYVKTSNDTIGVNNNGIYIKELSEYVLPDYILESAYVTKAEIKDNFDPYEIENWFWEFGIPTDDTYQATKFIFNQAGSFYNMATWEEEYIVEQYEYGYIFNDNGGSLFKYVKLGNLGWIMNKGE